MVSGTSIGVNRSTYGRESRGNYEEHAFFTFLLFVEFVEVGSSTEKVREKENCLKKNGGNKFPILPF